MGLIWKKRKGNWYLISEVYKRILEEVADESETTSVSRYDNNGILWYKHNNKWIDIFNPEKDFITTGDPAHDTIESVEDGDMVELKYRNIYVKRGHTLTVSKRCKGLILNTTGDLVIYGTISMSARGAAAEGRYVGVDYVNNKISISEDAITNPFLSDKFKVSLDTTKCDKCGLCYDACQYNAINLTRDETNTITNVTLDTEACVNCGACVDVCIEHGIDSFTKTYNIVDNTYVIAPYTENTGTLNTVGASGANGACGAGGNCGRALGGKGTSFSGGAGAGGYSYVAHTGGGANRHYYDTYTGTKSTAGDNNGGKGGNGGDMGSYGGAGGAGNPASTINEAGVDGTGGLFIAMVSGNIVINDTGIIQSNGSRGGNVTKYGIERAGSSSSGDSYRHYGGQGGGGSGGGAIHLFHKGSILNKGSLVAQGGAAGTSVYGASGRAGGNGTIHVAKVQPDGTLSY